MFSTVCIRIGREVTHLKNTTPLTRFLVGALAALALIAAGFAMLYAIIPSWNATPEEVALALPGDEQVPDPNTLWNHAVTVNTPAEAIYPWLVQIGDSRAAFYSIAFIENAFCAASGECRYVNADRVHEEWQNPVKDEQGIIIDYMLIHDYRPGEYVLAVASEKLPMNWTWLWYLRPVDDASTRLIVRHRIDYPTDMPPFLMETILNCGYVMERAMLLGIKARAEGMPPAAAEEPLGALVWLLMLVVGIGCAVRFVRRGGLADLGFGLAAVAGLFILTFIQPTLMERWAVLLLIAAGPSLFTSRIKRMPH